MSKEYLEALEHIYYGSQGYGETDKYYKYLKEYLESIDNAKPSEALEIIKKYAKNDGWADGWTIEFWNMTEKELTILDKVFKNEIPKTGLMDYNPTKQYLKWEDLEFEENKHNLKCKMNDSLYYIEWFIDGMGFKTVNIYLDVNKNYLEYCIYLQGDKKQFFNDLRLERVEE